MKRLIKFAVICLAIAALMGCGNNPEKKTLDSLLEIKDGIYIMDCYTEYKVDEYLEAGITDVEQFDIWMTENLTHGVPTGDIPDIGCSSFTVLDEDGHHLFGRNYDMHIADSLVIRTVPEDGYASIGIVDLAHINLGNYGDYDIWDEKSQSLLFAAPWCICDGINEMGLGVSLLELDTEHVVNDTSNNDLLIYSALRVILDKCANVDEALALLEGYDMYSPRTNSYHIYLTDITGKTVVAEWDENGDMVVTEDTAATNFPIYKGDTTLYCRRYVKIHNTIDEADTMTEDDAMAVLESVKQGTQWSAVYNLENFSVTVCFNMNYEEIYTYDGIKE